MVKFQMRSRDFTEFSVGALASLTAVIGGTKIDSARLQGCTIDDLMYQVSMFNKTAGASEGPLVFGVSHDNTTAEIATYYAADPQATSDELELQRSQFHIIELGRYGQVTQSDSVTPNSPMTKLQRAKWPGWEINRGTNWNHYIFNANPNDPLSTGALLQLYTQALGEWLRV